MKITLFVQKILKEAKVLAISLFIKLVDQTLLRNSFDYVTFIGWNLCPGGIEG